MGVPEILAQALGQKRMCAREFKNVSDGSRSENEVATNFTNSNELLRASAIEKSEVVGMCCLESGAGEEAFANRF